MWGRTLLSAPQHSLSDNILIAVNIVKSTRKYETWLASHTPIVKADLRLKHQRMGESAFPFLRATFYRWMQIWPELCPDLVKAPHVLGVGDLHVENFGTWRDADGRLLRHDHWVSVYRWLEGLVLDGTG